MTAAIPVARTASRGGAVNAPILRRSVVNMTGGTTAKLSCSDSTTSVRISRRAVSLQAQQVSPPDDLQILRLIQTLPQPVEDSLIGAPERFVENAADVIGGYGGPDGIDPAGIDLFIGVTRAAARSRTTARLLAADLDNDSAIPRIEIEALGQTLSAFQRGQLRRLFDGADANRDSTVTAAELRTRADADARKAISQNRELALRSLPLLDLDRDGLVSLAEVARVAAVARAAADQVAGTPGTPRKTDL